MEENAQCPDLARGWSGPHKGDAGRGAGVEGAWEGAGSEQGSAVGYVERHWPAIPRRCSTRADSCAGLKLRGEVGPISESGGDSETPRGTWSPEEQGAVVCGPGRTRMCVPTPRSPPTAHCRCCLPAGLHLVPLTAGPWQVPCTSLLAKQNHPEAKTGGPHQDCQPRRWGSH